MRGDERADLQAGSLLRIVLVLVVVWLALEIVGELVGITTAVLGPFRPLLGLVVIAVIVLWLLDRL